MGAEATAVISHKINEERVITLDELLNRPKPTPEKEPDKAEPVSPEKPKCVVEDCRWESLESLLKQIVDEMGSNPVKGVPYPLFANRSYSSLSDEAIDCQRLTALHVNVYVTGSGSPSATVSVEGSDASGGAYLPLPDPSALRVNVTANTSFDVIVGGIAFAKVRLSSIGGTFADGQGFTVIATPYLAPGIDSRDHVRRNGGVLHRSAIAAVDKLAVPAVSAVSGRTIVGGVLVDSTTYYATAAAANRYGPTTAATPVSGSPGGSNNALRVPIAQVSGAEYYDVFLSTDANPKWVTRVSEAQRAAGGLVTSVGGYAAGGTAGALDIGLEGTGLASNANPFVVNNAYTPASITAIDCAGRSRAHVLVALAVTDLRSLPTLSIVPFAQSQISGDWHPGTLQSVTLLTAVGQSLYRDYEIDVDGSTGLAVLVDTISGQGAAASIWVELV